MIKQEQWDKVLDGVKSGLTNKDAASLAGISEETLYKRVREDSEFSELLKKALVSFKQKHLKNITNHSEAQWQASAWILERKFKDEFGNKLNLEHSEKGLNELTPEELQEKRDKLKEKLKSAKSSS